MVVTRFYTLSKTHQPIHLKWVHFIICKLYLDTFQWKRKPLEDSTTHLLECLKLKNMTISSAGESMEQLKV